jgi:hypothetical protein
VFHQLTERCCTRRHRTVLRAPVSGKNERRRRRGLMPATWREHVSALPAAAAASGASRKPGLLSRSPSHSSNAHLTPSWERAESQAMPSQRGIRRQGPSRKPAEAPCSLRVEHGSGVGAGRKLTSLCRLKTRPFEGGGGGVRGSVGPGSIVLIESGRMVCLTWSGASGAFRSPGADQGVGSPLWAGSQHGPAGVAL